MTMSCSLVAMQANIFWVANTYIYDVVLCQGTQTSSERGSCVTKTFMSVFDTPFGL